MTPIDWLLVLGLNGVVVAYGVRVARRSSGALDWFLAGRNLPWWLVGLSLFATAVDSGDYVAVVGGAYTFGLANLATWWLGLPVGCFIVSYFVLVPVYRSGCFTNAEYLELRFGASMRLISALIQIQYRTNVLGNIAYSLFLMFSIPTGWGSQTWALVVAVALVAGAYSAWGGLRAVVMTDALQSVLILCASLVLWRLVWNKVGGWGGLEERFAALDPELGSSMLHVGGQGEPGVPAALVIFGWCMSLTAYCVVNHSQAMRLLAARSELDMKYAGVIASVALALVMWFNITLGVMARVVYPDLAAVDEAFPRMAVDFLVPGLFGLVAAGVLAGGISTYDSIGSSLAAVFARDVYQRFLAPDASEARCLLVSRAATVGFLLLSFAYIPLLQDGMVAFYLRLTSVAVIPLFTVFLLGAVTRVHRDSGLVGIVVGVGYGLTSFLGERMGLDLPIWWTNTWWAYLWSSGLTAGAMVAFSAVRGWLPAEESRGLVYRAGTTSLPASPPALSACHDGGQVGVAWFARPGLLSVVFLAVSAWLLLRVLW